MAYIRGYYLAITGVVCSVAGDNGIGHSPAYIDAPSRMCTCGQRGFWDVECCYIDPVWVRMINTTLMCLDDPLHSDRPSITHTSVSATDVQT